MQLRVTTWYLQVCFFASICISSFGPRSHKWILNWQVEPGRSSKNKPMCWWKSWRWAGLSVGILSGVWQRTREKEHVNVTLPSGDSGSPGRADKWNRVSNRAVSSAKHLTRQGWVDTLPPACHGSASLLWGRWGFFATPPPLVLPFFLFFFYFGSPTIGLAPHIILAKLCAPCAFLCSDFVIRSKGTQRLIPNGLYRRPHRIWSQCSWRCLILFEVGIFLMIQKMRRSWNTSKLINERGCIFTKVNHHWLMLQFMWVFHPHAIPKRSLPHAFNAHTNAW